MRAQSFSHHSQPVKRLSLISQLEQQNNLKTTLPLETNEYKYLPPIKPIHQEFNDSKWQEYKIEGKNISNRAYTAITAMDNYIYLYGGYQVSLGVMNDFYRMNIQMGHFLWEQIMTKDSPGPRTRHIICSIKNSIYLFGGQTQPSHSTNQMYQYDGQNWIKLKLNKTYPPEIDNHAGCLYYDKWLIFGGFFGGSIGLHSNYVFLYNFETNEWSKLFPPLNICDNLHAPTPREGAGIAIILNKAYIFGGSNGHERFNDLWQFDIDKQIWAYVKIKNQIIPKVRSGHSLNSWGNKLVLFGGIHDITWELDDLYQFDANLQEWEVVDEDSSRRKEIQTTLNQNLNSDSPPINVGKRKTKKSFSIKKGQSMSPKKGIVFGGKDHGNYKNIDQSLNEFTFETTSKNQMTLAQAHQKTLEEKKKKEFEAKKMNMLKQFDVNEQELIKMNSNSPTSEAMKNSLLVIGNPKSDLKIRPGKLTEFGKPTFSRFLQPLSTMQNSILGKKPCARDGHATIVVDHLLIIFGGDRHQMSFNDIHALDLSKLKQDSTKQ